MANKIGIKTRRDIFAHVKLEKIFIYGGDVFELFERVWDLERMPADNHNKFKNAREEIRGVILSCSHDCSYSQNDNSDDSIIQDSRFDLIENDDKIFLKFLCETIHPFIRTNQAEITILLKLFNKYLKDAGYQITESNEKLSNQAVYIANSIRTLPKPGINLLKKTISTVSDIALFSDITYINQQITNMETSVNIDPALAIGTAKELIETVCKTILDKCDIKYSNKDKLSELVKKTLKQLKLTPDNIPQGKKLVRALKYSLII